MNEQEVGVESSVNGIVKINAEVSSQVPEPVIKKVDRVTLTTDALLRIDTWKNQVESSRPGVEVSRRDLAEWLILKHSKELSPSEIKELSDTHYNELKFLKYAIRELKSAQERGEKIALHDMVKNLPAVSRSPKVMRERKKQVTPVIPVIQGETFHTENSPETRPSLGDEF